MENLQKEFVPYELALKLKELGFNEPCFAYYHDGFLEFCLDGHNNVCERKNSSFMRSVSAPTFTKAFGYFREKCGLSGWVNESFLGNSRQGIVSIKSEIGLKYNVGMTKIFETYEEAELACLEKLIEIVESKNI